VYSFEGRTPDVHPSAFVAPTATLIGDVTVEAGASIWFGAVLRGDRCPLVVREGANVQDNSVLHSTLLGGTEVGARATVAHLCVVHGATLEPECLVGNGAVVLDGARIGRGSFIAAGALVLGGRQIPPGVLVAGSPATVRRDLEGTPAQEWVRNNPVEYADLAARHASTLRLVEPADRQRQC
jgi:carbonic anhydrase/acetyltransferase-like protein (isoleucine patch superfamily)